MKNNAAETKEQDGRIAELKAKYGRLYMISTVVLNEEAEEVTHAFVMKPGTAKAYDRFIKDAAKKPSQAMKNLILDGVVEEDRERLQVFMEEQPVGAGPIAQQYLRLMGHTDDVNLTAL